MGKCRAEALDFRFQHFQDTLIFENLQARFSRGAPRDISGISMTVGERFTAGD
jgi:hypothetical protein